MESFLTRPRVEAEGAAGRVLLYGQFTEVWEARKYLTELTGPGQQ